MCSLVIVVAVVAPVAQSVPALSPHLPPLPCRRDEALSSIQDAIREQDQQELNIQNEIEGYKKDIAKEQIKNEQMTALLRKVEAESGFITKQIEASVERQGRLQEVFAKLAKSLEHTEEQIKRTLMEHKVRYKL